MATWMLLVGRFQSSLKHRKTALGSIIGLVGIAPISNQELKKTFDFIYRF